MKIGMTLLVLMLLAHNTFAQTAIAKLKFEDAEQSYNNGDYKAAITSLDEAEKLFGKTNPLIQHMKIMSMSKFLAGKDLFVDTAAMNVFNSLWKNCQSFLQKNGEDDRLSEKYKDVYNISESIKNGFPLATIQRINELKQQPTAKNLYQLFSIYDNLSCTSIAAYYRNEAIIKGYLPPIVIDLCNHTSEQNQAQLALQYKPLMKLVNEGDMHAAHAAALVYESNITMAAAFDPSTPDRKSQLLKGIKMNEKAAAAGNIKAMEALGYLYKHGDLGLDIERDTVKAINWYTRAIEKGSADAAAIMGWWYHDKNDFQQTKDYFTKGIKNGGSNTSFIGLGSLYEEGEGVEKNYATAMHYYNFAVGRGSASAYGYIAGLYYGGPNLEKNLATAMEWYKKGAEKNDRQSMSNLAWMYLKGQSVPANADEAEKWTIKAARAGRVASMITLAENYTKTGYHDAGVYFCYKLDKTNYDKYNMTRKQNDSLAAYWFMEAAKKEDPRANAQVGMFYLGGLNGFEENEETAMNYFRLGGDTAAYTRACFLIGLEDRLYKTPQRSIHFLTKAAERGDRMAMLNLALRYKRGVNGYPKDKDKARFWDKKYMASF